MADDADMAPEVAPEVTRVLLIKPGDVLIFGNLGHMEVVQVEQLLEAVSVLKERVGLAEVLMFEEDIEIGACHACPSQRAGDVPESTAPSEAARLHLPMADGSTAIVHGEPEGSAERPRPQIVIGPPSHRNDVDLQRLIRRASARRDGPTQ